MNGLIKDKSDRGFNGDYDLFRIQYGDGNTVEDHFAHLGPPKSLAEADKLKKQVWMSCKRAGVEHGAVEDWKAKAKEDPYFYRMFLDLKKAHEGDVGLLRIHHTEGPAGGGV